MEYFSKSAVRERGWTQAMVRQLLGEADQTARNPHFRSAAPRQLYLQSRVLVVENTEAYLRAKETASKCSRAAKKAVDSKRAELLERIDQITVTLHPVPLERLMALSLRVWKERKARELAHSNCDLDRDGSNADLDTRRRWAVNFARHELTEYDHHLEEVAGKVGIDRAVQAIRTKVFVAIAETWPDLADECARQLGQTLPSQQDTLCRISTEGPGTPPWGSQSQILKQSVPDFPQLSLFASDEEEGLMTVGDWQISGSSRVIKSGARSFLVEQND